MTKNIWMNLILKFLQGIIPAAPFGVFFCRSVNVWNSAINNSHHDEIWTIDHRVFHSFPWFSIIHRYQLIGGLEHEFYFPIYWQVHNPSCYSLHHFSEG